MSENTKLFARKGELRIRFGGSGGQGAVLAATMLGEAAVASGLRAAGSSSYGSQARGGAASSDLIVGREPIDYPHVSHPDLFVAMSQEAYDESRAGVPREGLILYDTFFVKPVVMPGVKQIGVPATQTVLDRLGTSQGANVLMVGAVIEATGVVGDEAIFCAIAANLDKRFHEQSKKAYAMGKELVVGKL